MPFRSELVVTQVGDVDWRLREDLRYEGATECFIIPVDFLTDFASIPKPVQWLIPRSGRHTKAAVLHDMLWRYGDRLYHVRRSDADGIFRRTMRELGVSALQRWVMWAAVRIVSVFGSGLRDRPHHLLGAFAIAVGPGLLIGVGAAAFLIAAGLFWVLEWLWFPVLWLAHRAGITAHAPSPPSFFLRG